MTQRTRFALSSRRAGDAPVELKSRQDVVVFIREANSFFASIHKRNKKTPPPVIPCFVSIDAVVELLSRNHSNRNVIRSAAADYTLAMQQGKWIDFGGSAIQLGPDGSLLNGQNRLLAAYSYMDGIKNLRIGFNFEVGVTQDVVQSSTDHGRSRTPRDYLALMGVQADAKALRMALFAPNSTEFRLDGETVSYLYDLFKDEHDFVFAEIDKYTDSTLRIKTKTAVLGALIRAAHYVTRPKLARFIELLCSKPGEAVPADDSEQAVLRFRESVISGLAGGKVQRCNLYAAATSAISRFQDGRPASRQRTTKQDLFPLKPEADKFLRSYAKDTNEARGQIARTKQLNLSPNFSKETKTYGRK